jgi:predicted metal-dependent hydrolase
MTFLDTFVLFILIVMAIMYYRNQYSEVEYVQSKEDNRKYLVLKLHDKQEAADTIAKLVKDAQKLVDYLEEKYPEKKLVKRLVDNFNPDNISEGDVDTGYTSYTINKGKMVLCIRQKNKKKTLIKDMNLLRYVIIHELGHIASKSIGHTKEFWDTFKFILKEAMDAGIYTKVDYAKNPQPYCGIVVSSSVV